MRLQVAMTAADGKVDAERASTDAVDKKRAGMLIIVTIAMIGAASLAFRPKFHDGDTVTIRNMNTGKYLAVGADGKLRAIADSGVSPAARFRLVVLNPNTIAALRERPAHPQLTQGSHSVRSAEAPHGLSLRQDGLRAWCARGR